MKGNIHFIALAAIIGLSIAHYRFIELLAIIALCLILMILMKFPIHLQLICITVLSVMALYPSSSETPPSRSTKEQYYHITVKTLPEYKDNYIEFIGQDIKTQEKNIVYIFVQEIEPLNISVGATCSFLGANEVPDGARNPGQFDYNQFLSSKNISSILTVELTSLQCSGSSMLSPLYEFRKSYMDHIANVYSANTAAWIFALVFGDDANVKEETILTFQRWNLSHLLAISGLHVGLFIGFWSYLGIRTNIVSKERLKVLLIIFLPVYSVIAGGAPSVIRAVSMTTLFILVTMLKKKWKMTDLLSVLVLISVFWKPYLLSQLAFQFSFLVTFCLLLSKGILKQSTSPIHSILIVSLISQLAILPLQLNAFYTYNPLSLFINVAFIPLITIIILPFCLLLSIISFIPFSLHSLFDKSFHESILLMEKVLYVIDDLFYLELIVGETPDFIFILFYLFFIFMMQSWEGKRLKATVLFSVILVFILMFPAIHPYFSSKGRVMMLDVGQGDTFIIELPYRKQVIMIDAAHVRGAKEEETFKRIIKPYLHSRGINKVDTLILTHQDMDHMGSAIEVMERFQVETLITSPFYQMESEFKQELIFRDMYHKAVRKGDQFLIESLTFHVLHPTKDEKNKNNNSLILNVEIGGVSWLFTGDVDAEMESRLAESGMLKSVDVLKVAHHGSRFSSSEALINETQPSVAWISVGKRNKYGHPASEVIEKLRRNDITIMRTDLHGAIYYEYSNETGTFYRHLP